MDKNNLLKQAQSAYDKKEYRQAFGLFQRVAVIADNENRPMDAAELKNNASVSALLAKDFQLALSLAENTHQFFVDAGDLKRGGMALANQASALDELGESRAALEKFGQAAQYLLDAGDNDSRTYVLKRMSALQIKLGKQFEALGTINAALDNAETLSSSEKTLKKLSNLVMNLLQR